MKTIPNSSSQHLFIGHLQLSACKLLLYTDALIMCISGMWSGCDLCWSQNQYLRERYSGYTHPALIFQKITKNSGAPAKPIKVNYCSDDVKGGKMEKGQTS